MRMRKRPNLAPRMEKCAELMINEPETMRGHWRELMPDCAELHIELGCGKGRFTAGTAAAAPDVELIAIEKVPDAMIIAMERVKNQELKNVRFISADVAGLRAVLKKGFEDIFWSLDADFFCLQETKLQAGQVELDLPGYESYWCYAERKGYSGTAIFTKHTPLSVSYNLGLPEHDTEGRVITLEYDNFYLVCVYTPNAQDGLKRIDYRMSWEDAFRDYLVGLDAKKPVIVCGDMNVAHNEIDLKNPKTNIGNPGFSFEERGKFTELLDAGFTDSFRYLYPDKTDAYSWWSYRAAARERNVGWRIDYFVVSDRLREKIKDAYILPEITGSDHCPVGLDVTW